MDVDQDVVQYIYILYTIVLEIYSIYFWNGGGVVDDDVVDDNVVNLIVNHVDNHVVNHLGDDTIDNSVFLEIEVCKAVIQCCLTLPKVVAFQIGGFLLKFTSLELGQSPNLSPNLATFFIG